MSCEAPSTDIKHHERLRNSSLISDLRLRVSCLLRENKLCRVISSQLFTPAPSLSLAIKRAENPRLNLRAPVESGPRRTERYSETFDRSTSQSLPRKPELSSFIHSKWLTGAERKQAEAHFSSVCPSFNYSQRPKLSFPLFMSTTCFGREILLFCVCVYKDVTIATIHWKGTTSITVWIYISFIISTA